MTYTKGRAFEYRIKYRLQDLGFYVMRSYGSKGAADLLAIPPPSKSAKALLIQAKYGGYVPPDEMAKLRAISTSGLVIIVYIARNRMHVRDVHSKDRILFDDFIEAVYGLGKKTSKESGP